MNTATLTQTDLVRELQDAIRGEVYADRMRAALYATDASIYQQIPLAVCVPRTRDDVVEIVRIARRHQVPILGRGAGTSLAGQTTATKAIVVDFSKYLNRILEVNAAERWVRVEPGIVRDQLNTLLEPYGLMFAPETATSNRANIGGMVGNNSSGMLSIRYGRTSEHVLEVDTVLSDGSVARFGRAADEESNPEFAKEIRAKLSALAESNRGKIESQWPKVPRRACGYPLDQLVAPERNLAKFLTGSEGTLGIFLEMKLNLVPVHKAVAAMAIHYADYIKALETAPLIVSHGPLSVELVDRACVVMARENPGAKHLTEFVEGTPEIVLFVECTGDTFEEAQRNLRAIEATVRETAKAYAFVHAKDDVERNKMIELRKAGLGIVAKQAGEGKPVSFVEDACVPLDRMAEYFTDMIRLCEDEGLEYVTYGHASVGVLHFKPILDLKKQKDLETMDRVSSRVVQLVKKYGGCWSGEHGDGIIRGSKNHEFWDAEFIEMFREVKRLFDPEGLFNPGKIIDTPKITENQRFGPDYRATWNAKYFRFGSEGGFQHAVELCNGVGQCRKDGDGVMCPSYMATLDEADSTRGRANALRMAMSGQLGPNAMTGHDLHRVLDLCLECKACKTECPNNVDMAKMKSEFLAAYHEKHGATMRDRMFAFNGRSAALSSGVQAHLLNPMLKLTGGAMKKMLGIAPQRSLPEYAPQTFEAWYRIHTAGKPNGNGNGNGKAIGQGNGNGNGRGQTAAPTVAIFLDTYVNHYEPEMGKWLVRLLEHLGVHIELAKAGCCGRPMISKGFLKEAKANGNRTMANLDVYARRGVPVIVLEPSCLSALKDDLPDLIDDVELGKRVAAIVTPADKAIEALLKTLGRRIQIDKARTPSFLMHGHCHQKTQEGTHPVHRLFRSIGAEIREIGSGCCGMAGSFGYEEEHYDLSMKIGEQRLFPAIRKADKRTILIANGFSCRHQIHDGTKRDSMHFVEAFARAVLGEFKEKP